MHAPEGPPGDHVRDAVDSPGDASAAFDLLSDHRRRLLLYCLRDHAEEPAELEVVLSAWLEHRQDEVDESVAAVEAHHVHLPKLEETGVIEYDPAARTIEYLGHPLLDACLEMLHDVDLGP